MTPREHSRILFAYLSRLTIAERDEIEASLKVWDMATLNRGLSAQLEASARTQDAIERACLHLTAEDRAQITTTIRGNV